MVKKNIKSFTQKLYLVIMLIVLYMPIAVLIISSVNASEKNKAVWGGFTLRAYKELVKDEVIMGALYNTACRWSGHNSNSAWNSCMHRNDEHEEKNEVGDSRSYKYPAA